jgi:anti-sigma factor RsiW
MNEDIHKKAEGLITTARVEGLSDSDREWLSSHLEECAICAGRAENLVKMLVALRSIPITLDPAVVEATRRRVRMRARDLREDRSRMRALWVSCSLSWVLGIVTAPLLWQGFKWTGRHLALPDLAWQAAFLLWWLVPAAIVSGALAWWFARASGEAGDEIRVPR